MMKKISNVNYTLHNNLCTGCGICESACPSHAIAIIVKNGENIPYISEKFCNNNKGCHRCFDVCPGIGINLVEKAKFLYNETNVKKDIYLGRYIKCYSGHSTDEYLRYHSASGGMVSQFLIWLLENEKIDGAVVTRFDKESPLKVKTFIAKTREEIIASKSSKYGPVSFHTVINDLKHTAGERFVIVGLPCHVAGIRKLAEKDKRLREKIVGVFSLYCSGTRTFNFTKYILKNRCINIDKIDYLAYRDNGCLGGLVVKGEGIDYYEDYQRYSHPLRTIFYPRRCLLCADHFGELADICFGDIHIMPYSKDKTGINSVVVRNNYWDHLLYQSYQAGVITLEHLDEEILLKSQKMAMIKKRRNMAFCLLNKKLGRDIPDYGTFYNAHIKIKDIVDYVRMSIERFIGRHKWCWFIIPVIKSKVHIH